MKKKLENPREVMLAFLAGYKLINKHYKDETGENYLYLDESGYIAEEDGAGAKGHRVNHFDYRGEDPEWEIIDPQSLIHD